MKPKKLIQCLIIDDELSSQRVLQHFVSETEILDLKATCSTTAEAFKYLQLYGNIDVLFLDINMPQQSGLDFYKSLKNPPQVIFTTAYSQYAVDGFEVNAIDYLLKPIDSDDLIKSVSKINVNKDKNVLGNELKLVLKNFMESTTQSKIALPLTGKTLFLLVFVEEILKSDISFKHSE